MFDCKSIVGIDSAEGGGKQTDDHVNMKNLPDLLHGSKVETEL